MSEYDVTETHTLKVGRDIAVENWKFIKEHDPELARVAEKCKELFGCSGVALFENVRYVANPEKPRYVEPFCAG